MFLERRWIIDKIRFPQPYGKNPPAQQRPPQAPRYCFDFRKFRHEGTAIKIAHPFAASQAGPSRTRMRGGISAKLLRPAPFYFGAASGGGQKPGSLIARSSIFSAYFFTEGPISAAFPISTKIKLKCLFFLGASILRGCSPRNADSSPGQGNTPSVSARGV